MDAIAAYQHGFDNVVASMGTALTEHQVAEIRRLTNRVTMALDPDAAGRQATLRSLESSWRVFQTQVAGRVQGTTLFQRQDMPDLRIAVLPSGLDPDALIRQSTEEWSRIIEGAVPLLEYLFDALSAQVDSSTPQGKARLVELLFPMIAAVSEPTVQDHYFQLLADQLGVTEETLRATVGRPSAAGPRRARVTNRTVTASPFARMDHDPLEEYCLTLLFKYPELQGSEEELRPEYFQRLENREVFSQWCKVSGEGDNQDSLLALRQGIEEHLQDHLGGLLNKEIPPLDSRQRTPAFLDGVRRLEERYLRELKTEEEIRFGDAEADIPEETYQAALQVNQRIKTNQAKRGIKVGDL
jgi:DNA primase